MFADKINARSLFEIPTSKKSCVYSARALCTLVPERDSLARKTEVSWRYTAAKIIEK